MAEKTVTAPNPKYNGVTAGIQFQNGVGKFDGSRAALVQYFERHGYVIGAGEPEQPAEVDLAQTSHDEAGLKGLTVDQLHEYAGIRGIPVEGKPKKGDLVALILAAGPVPTDATTAGDGPVGAQHNQGHDGANPDGAEPPVAPADAAI